MGILRIFLLAWGALRVQGWGYRAAARRVQLPAACVETYDCIATPTEERPMCACRLLRIATDTVGRLKRWMAGPKAPGSWLLGIGEEKEIQKW
ncbi:hypothetical protein PF010_g15844 [Phytophthora fragariae]|uniref:Uncharacterized protein n=1 Tax=Phytophthora fragariae TaxID=53985 RepID=A0A6A3GVY3_9STRA|nr:hypothetical protein PF011_g29837 [Phytophthora fragariae]KAE9097721.1 hypothetical protein PF010_g15844 [Phytophthora fragariae]KAE9164240.1 hypothetical protein PF004_g29894 [Phytophthora fragariae]KAE9273444.1 hypothetical protein PF008_g29834 [Phytophthora fragariae]